MPLRMQRGQTLRYVVDPKDLKCVSRTEVLKGFVNWEAIVLREKARYMVLLAAVASTFLAGVMLHKFILILLVPLAPFVLRAQFNQGDSAGDMKRWARKKVTRINTEDDKGIDEKVIP